MKQLFRLLLLVLLALFGLFELSNTKLIVPVRQESLTETRVYAYRGWQSMGMQIDKDHEVHIRATGRWLYTPDDYHGPNGHSRFSAPSFYPVSGIPGGALIGRIGENGAPFYVGERYTRRGTQTGMLYRRINDDIVGESYTRPATQTGILYLRINDDIVGDNDGWVVVDIAIE